MISMLDSVPDRAHPREYRDFSSQFRRFCYYKLVINWLAQVKDPNAIIENNIDERGFHAT